LSQPIQESDLATHQTVCLNEMFEKRLIPFIKINYPENNRVFLPLLACSYYAKYVQEYLAAQNI
jgi:hypothetical protein